MSYFVFVADWYGANFGPVFVQHGDTAREIGVCIVRYLSSDHLGALHRCKIIHAIKSGRIDQAGTIFDIEEITCHFVRLRD
jgi:hypothetical protein